MKINPSLIHQICKNSQTKGRRSLKNQVILSSDNEKFGAINIYNISSGKIP